MLSIEAEALARINHPSVVSFRGKSASGDFIVMEYIPGHTLHEVALPSEAVLRLALHICDALSAVHAAGVIHRDLKPENVLVTHDRMSRIALIDFGSAKICAPDHEDPYIYGAVGTAEFMPPELLNSGASADERSDVFSLGALVYAKLAGVPPFPVSPDEPFCHAVELRRRMKPLPLGQKNPSIPPEVCAVVDRALSDAPEGRYQSAREFKQAIVRCMASA
jgi:serine/threonine-protein kinase